MINKQVASAQRSVQDIPDGATVMIGGFGGSGLPEALIRALRDHGAKNLTVVANNVGGVEYGVGFLIANRQVRKVLCSFPIGRRQAKLQDIFWDQYHAGTLEVELVPQGTLAERIRAGGAGIAAFYTRAGVGTSLAEKKEVRAFDGRDYVLEEGIKADFALLKAHKADRMGNLLYRKAMRNFNPMMAAAARTTIAEVYEVVDAGILDPELIVTPGIYVDRIVEVKAERKWE
jgi:3-oxoadipate CoA-transferase alpha subunit